MHRKDLGSLGEIATAKHLKSQGYPVFFEFGDNSRIDLIALADDCPIKIQVKASILRNGRADFSFRKTGPNGYTYLYTQNDVDVFALYAADIDQLAFMSSVEALQTSKVALREVPPKGSCQFRQRLFSEYTSFEEALRDFTPSTLTSNAEGEEKVQTTTSPSDLVMET